MRPVLALLGSLFLTCAATFAQTPPSTLRSYFANKDAIQTGGARLISIKTPKGEFKVWTKRFGNNPRIKLLLLHGGPGGTHEYFESLEGFLPAEGIEFIYYDQLGSGFSDQPKDKDLWTTARFVEEVEQVRIALGLNKDNFYLLGHSWGGILAAEYALKYGSNLKGPDHLQHDDEHPRLQPLRRDGARQANRSRRGEGAERTGSQGPV